MARNSGLSDGFLNVDVEVYSLRPLDPLAAALEEAAHILFVGKNGSRYLAAIELAGSGWQRTPDAIIMGLTQVIKALPEPARHLWNTASERRFDIGCDSPSGPRALALALKPTTVAAIAEVNGTIAITIYPRVENKAQDAATEEVREPTA